MDYSKKNAKIKEVFMALCFGVGLILDIVAYAISSWSNSEFDVSSDWLRGLRAMMILGLLCYIVTTGLSFAFACAELTLSYRSLCLKSLRCIGFGAMTFLLTAIIIDRTKRSENDRVFYVIITTCVMLLIGELVAAKVASEQFPKRQVLPTSSSLQYANNCPAMVGPPPLSVIGAATAPIKQAKSKHAVGFDINPFPPYTSNFSSLSAREDAASCSSSTGLSGIQLYNCNIETNVPNASDYHSQYVSIYKYELTPNL